MSAGEYNLTKSNGLDNWFSFTGTKTWAAFLSRTKRPAAGRRGAPPAAEARRGRPARALHGAACAAEAAPESQGESKRNIRSVTLRDSKHGLLGRLASWREPRNSEQRHGSRSTPAAFTQLNKTRHSERPSQRSAQRGRPGTCRSHTGPGAAGKPKSPARGFRGQNSEARSRSHYSSRGVFCRVPGLYLTQRLGHTPQKGACHSSQ